MEGPGLCDRISGTDPLRDNLALLKAEAADDSAEARHTASVVNEVSSEIRKLLTSHPINKERKEQVSVCRESNNGQNFIYSYHTSKEEEEEEEVEEEAPL